MQLGSVPRKGTLSDTLLCPAGTPAPGTAGTGVTSVCHPMLSAAPSPGALIASVWPLLHLLALLILPQVQCPFGQSQPILVNLQGETGTVGEVRAVLGKAPFTLPVLLGVPGSVRWQPGESASGTGRSCTSVSLLLEGAGAEAGSTQWVGSVGQRTGSCSTA